MHILAAFIIMMAFVNGFHPLSDEPEDNTPFILHADHHVIARTNIVPQDVIQFRNLVKQSYDFSCGSAALATLLNGHLGENFNEKQVIHGLMQYGDKEQIAARRAFSLLDMKRFVSVLGYKGAGYRATMEDLLTPDYWPCIIPIQIFDYRHFVVFRGVYKNHVFLADPWRGHTSYTLDTFEDMWFQNVMFLVSNGHKHRNLLRLTEEDLRFIDEDTAKAFVLDEVKPFHIPPELEVDLPYDGQHYKP